MHKINLTFAHVSSGENTEAAIIKETNGHNRVDFKDTVLKKLVNMYLELSIDLCIYTKHKLQSMYTVSRFPEPTQLSLNIFQTYLAQNSAVYFVTLQSPGMSSSTNRRQHICFVNGTSMILHEYTKLRGLSTPYQSSFAHRQDKKHSLKP